MTKITEPLGNAIRSAYREAGLRQEDIATALGVSQSTISDWTNGYSQPSVTQIVALDQACGRKPGYIMERAGLLAEGTLGSRSREVAEEGFMTTALWQQTLGVRRGRDRHRSERERLRSSYLRLRRNITPLLAEHPGSRRHETVHDVSHVDALWETASLACGDAITLNPAEAYVLGCAFALHDAAIGQAAYPDGIAEVMGRDRWRDLVANRLFKETGHWPDAAEIDAPSAEIERAVTVEAIRQLHAERAASLVEKAFRLTSGTDFHFISEPELHDTYGQLVGRLAWSHWWSIDRLPSEFRHVQGSPPWLPEEWTVDPLKVACVLRVADATQLDSRRAPSVLSMLRDPQGPQRDHWRIQEHMTRSHRKGERLVYMASRPFERQEASAWWLALDYLRKVDRLLKRVDDLLQDLDKPRLATRGVAYVDDPERFAEVFPVDGWRPIDANVQISDAQRHITELGGEQLYGRSPEVAVRELIQNAQDAVVARRVIDPMFRDGEVVVSLEQLRESWLLEVSDNGIGMDEEIIRRGLLDFGHSGWNIDAVHSKFVGLASNGFRPAGRFGVGFYSVFMLGDQVTVTTKRYDLGHDDARRLTFDHGLSTRPLLCKLPLEEPLAGFGTAVRVKLKDDPTASLAIRSTGNEITGLVQRLVPNRRVPMTIKEWFDPEPRLLAPFDLGSAGPEEVFEQLYPSPQGSVRDYENWAELRQEFCAQATEILDGHSQRLGLAVLGQDLVRRNPTMKGVMTLDGFRADEHEDFTGYMTGKPGRASRDNVDPACTAKQLTNWITDQIQRLLERDKLDPSQQLEVSEILYRATGTLPGDHHIAMTSDGLVTVNEIRRWASERDEVLFSYGWPCEWRTRPPALHHEHIGTSVTLPSGWIVPYLCTSLPYLDAALPRNRDISYEHHQHDPEDTWEKRWWLASDLPDGLIFKLLCEAWACQMEDLLVPVAKRGWDDYADLGIPDIEPAPVLHLRRP